MINDVEIKKVSICGKVFFLTKEELYSLKNPTRLQSKRVQYAFSDMLEDDINRVIAEYTNDIESALSCWNELPVSH